MKSVVQIQRSGALRVVEAPPPMPLVGQVRVLNAYSLISAGTERARLQLARKSLLGKARARPDQVRLVLETLQREGPIATYRKVMNRLLAFDPLGYSSAGMVAEVGQGVSGLTPGDLVACAGAGYANHAEVVAIPENLCARLPRSLHAAEDWKVPLKWAAFGTVGAIAMHGVRQAEVRVGEVGAVVGLGLVGLLTVQILKAAGCRVLGVDPVAERCELARKLGADLALSEPAHARESLGQLAGGRGADWVLLTAATPNSGPVELAGELARDRARIIVVGDVGLDLPRRLYYEKELELRLSRSYGPGRYDRFYEEQGMDYPIGYVRWTEGRNIGAFLEMVAQGSIQADPLLSHVFPVEQAGEAYSKIMAEGEDAVAVLLSYERNLAAIESSEQPPTGRVDVLKSRVDRASSEPPASTGKGIMTPSVVSSRRMSLALVGAGNFAQSVLLPHLTNDPRVHLRAVVSAGGLSAVAAAERFGADYASSDPEDLWREDGIDAVVIATRHGNHADLVVQAIQAEKPIFVEKPLAIKWQELRRIKELIEEWEAAGSVPFVQVGFNRRFSIHTSRLKDFVEASEEPCSIDFRVNAGPLAPDHWLHDPEQGGGRIIGEGCHFVDLLIFLAGCLPDSVFGQSMFTPDVPTLENVLGTFSFEDGSVGTLAYITNGSRGLPKELLAVRNGREQRLLDDFRRTSKGDRRWNLPGAGWLTGMDKGHKAELEAFVEAVVQGGGSPLPVSESVESTLWTFAIVESVRLGRRVNRAEMVARLNTASKSATRGK